MGKGKTYLVSGSSRGVGLALVKELLSKKDDRIVFAAARSPHKSEELQQLAKEHKDRLHIIVFDVTDGDSAQVRACVCLYLARTFTRLCAASVVAAWHCLCDRCTRCTKICALLCRKLLSRLRRFWAARDWMC